jgi:hypothetical protein
MERMHPFWSHETQQAFTEAALAVFARGERERLTERVIVSSLSRESIAWARHLPHVHDESFRTTFMDMLQKNKIVTYSIDDERYAVGEWGNLLVTEYLEDMLR